MPMPRSFRRLARFLNPAVLPLARRLPPLAVVHHVGRTSGRPYENPVMAFETDDGWIVSLAYGSDVQWARNLEHARGGELTRAGQRHQVGAVRTIARDRAAPALPGWARRMLRTARVDDFLLLTR
jgi:deazaflavin-dependent oxidoreductase (nitroreductase family)